MRSFEKNSRRVVGEVYERAASKRYIYTGSQGTYVSLLCHSAALGHRIAFGRRQQEYLGCRATAANARLSGEGRADGCVTHRRVGWNAGRLRERANSAPGGRIPDQAELQRRKSVV